MAKSFITGWDVGGAHLKVARCDSKGNITNVIQVSCELWKGLDHLKKAVNSVHQQLNNFDDFTAITMTGELVDLFRDRQQGVTEIIDCLSTQLHTKKFLVYAKNKGWISENEAKNHWQDVASMNWHASASIAAHHIENGLFIDLGSTTCDIIPIKNGQVKANGENDFQRQTTGELLYTGAIRTPLIALANQGPFNGKQVGLAAELFATSGDCWVLLGKLNGERIDDNSADGRSWSQANCAQRLARLLGTDANTADLAQWQKLALWFTQQQQQLISNACLQILSDNNIPTSSITIVGAGIGRFIVEEFAQQLSLKYLDLHTLLGYSLAEISDHAPAAAIALLAQQQIT